jgi:hypothetical protein
LAKTEVTPMDFRFVFGAPCAFTARLRAGAEGDEGGSAQADAALYRAGFEFVRDAEGTAFDAAGSSFSGTDCDRSFAPAAASPSRPVGPAARRPAAGAAAEGRRRG